MVAPDDSGDRLGRRLEAALADLGATDVDPAALLRGSARRARVVRGRRVAALGAAGALLVALPVGYEVANRPVDLLDSSAALVPAPAPATGYALSTIPDIVRPPIGSVLVPTGDVEDPGSVIAGQRCTWGVGRARTGPQATRTWIFAEGTDPAGGNTVTVTVTGWPAGRARQAFAQVRSGSGPCRWDAPQVALARPLATGDDVWEATSTSTGGLGYARALVRRGAIIVGVEVHATQRASQPLTRASDQAIRTAENLASQTLTRIP